MTKQQKVIEKLQFILEQFEYGTLMAVEIINKDELDILTANFPAVAQKFFLLIKDLCEEVEGLTILKSEKLTKLYLIVSQPYVGQQLAHLIYARVQCYLDQDFPTVYFQCRIVSVNFPRAEFDDLNNLLLFLSYSMMQIDHNKYYYDYDYDPVDFGKLKEDNLKLNLLRRSLQNKKAYFAYQPVVNRTSGVISYYECLLRIPSKGESYISIGSIIKDAEKRGFASMMDLAVIEMAITELENDAKVILSVNISNIGVTDSYLLSRIDKILAQTHVAERLIIEITETSLNKDIDSTRRFINNLRQHGCQFALDDFGSGFTSFKQLAELPIDIIKIDGSYIRDLAENPISRFFVEAIIKLARDLGKKTVAEFVENSSIAQMLMELEVDFMQGHFFLPASDKRL